MDSNGDGKVSLQEFEDNMPDALREKLDEIIASGWKFDPALWDASVARHAADAPCARASATHTRQLFSHRRSLDEDRGRGGPTRSHAAVSDGGAARRFRFELGGGCTGGGRAAGRRGRLGGVRAGGDL